MPKRATILRKTVWYQRYKSLAQSLDGKGTADILRAVHNFLNINFKYGSMTAAAAAHDSVELIIEEQHLEGGEN